MSMEAWGVCVALIALGSYGLGYLFGKRRYNEDVERGTETECATSDDAYESARNIRKFLFKRAWVCDTDKCSKENVRGISNEEKFRALLGGGWVVPVRIAHALGCELIVRQVTGTPAPAGEEDNEVRSRMRREWYAGYKPRPGVASENDGRPKPINDFYEKDGVMDTLRRAGKI